jgi:hypothetical protein
LVSADYFEIPALEVVSGFAIAMEALWVLDASYIGGKTSHKKRLSQ